MAAAAAAENPSSGQLTSVRTDQNSTLMEDPDAWRQT